MNNLKRIYELPHVLFFLWVIVLPLIISMIISFLIYPVGGLSFCKSKSCFEFALEYFSLPIKTLFFESTLSALIFNYLRTHTQLVSAERQRQQNIFSNFYKHYEEFEKYMKTEIESLDWLECKDINFRKLYSYFFPEAKRGGFKLYEHVNNKLINIEQYRKSQDDNFPTIFNFEEHSRKIEMLGNELGIITECSEPKDFFKIEESIYNLINLSVNYWWFDSENLKVNTEKMSYRSYRKQD